MRREDIDLVRSLPLFAGVSEDHLDNLLRGAFLQRFPSHVELIREGEPADFLHVMIEGLVEIFARYRERETTVSVVGPGSCFILAATVLDRPYLQSARVLSPARILMIPAESVREIFGADAQFARSISHELARAYRDVAKELKNQKLRGAMERVAAWLVRYNEETGGGDRFELPFDKKVLASRLGMVPEVLSRTFVNLKQYGVTVEGRRVTINDLSGLSRLASPDELIDNPSS